ncbi:MAG: GNAT family N-acetyltransferase [Bacteroidales bacterium]|nr:GNAT family N-acetyltransferase [Bacteroidales bacterium]
MKILEATTYSHELLTGINLLLPQLSQGAAISGKDLSDLIASPDSRLFISVDDQGKITGMFTLGIYRIPTGRKVWIEDVVVDKRERGRGTGEALMRFAIDFAVKNGYRSLELTSRPERIAANKLYRKLGFKPRKTNVYRMVIENR